MDKQTKVGPNIRANKDRYGWHIIIDGYRSAMPDESTAKLLAAAPRMLEALRIASAIAHATAQDSLYDAGKRHIDAVIRAAEGA